MTRKKAGAADWKPDAAAIWQLLDDAELSIRGAAAYFFTTPSTIRKWLNGGAVSGPARRALLQLRLSTPQRDQSK